MKKLIQILKDFAYEWNGKKRSKSHIDSEFKRHNTIAIRSCEYLGIFPFALALYFLGEGKFYFHYFFLSLIVLYISNWAPDFLYLMSNFIKRRKTYIPTHKRKYSHSTLGLVSWSIAIGFILSLFLTNVFWIIIISSFAFIGYWLHLAVDKVELFVDKIVEFFEKAVKE